MFTGSRLLAITTPLGEPSWLHYFPAPSSDSVGPGASIFDRINDLYHKYVFGNGYTIVFDWQFNQIARLTGGKVRYWKVSSSGFKANEIMSANSENPPRCHIPFFKFESIS